jgi:hypothetical protein
MASWWTNKGKADLAKTDPTAATLRILLVNTAPASQAAAADLNFVADVVAGELSGTGYARQTLAGVTVTEDDTNDRAILDATDPATYAGINAGTIAGAWIYRRVGGADSDAVDVLWCWIDTPDLVTNGGDVNVAFAATGISTIS